MGRRVPLLGLLLAGCLAEFPERVVPGDAEVAEGGVLPAPDARPAPDAAPAADARAPDADLDAGERDVGLPDAAMDGGPEAGPADSAIPDAEPPDAGEPPDAAPPRPPRHPGWCVEEVDVGQDGRIDARVVRTYTPQGLLVRIDHDADADGRIDARVDRVHDHLGQLTTLLLDYEADGRHDHRQTYHYDAAGRLTLIEFDNGVNGRIDARWHYLWSPAGTRVERHVDANADGIMEDRWTAELQPDGLTWINRNDRFDGRYLQQHVDRYAPHGGVVLHEEYWPVDRLVRRTVSHYDEAGNLVLAETDDPAGGPIERVHTYDYDCWLR